MKLAILALALIAVVTARTRYAERGRKEEVAAKLRDQFLPDTACSNKDLHKIGKAVRKHVKEAFETGVAAPEPTDAELEAWRESRELSADCTVAEIKAVGQVLIDNFDEISAILRARKEHRGTSSEERRERPERTSSEERRERPERTSSEERRERPERTSSEERRERPERTSSEERRERPERTSSEERRERPERTSSEERRERPERTSSEERRERPERTSSEERRERPERTSSEEERRSRGGKGHGPGKKVAALLRETFFADSPCSDKDLHKIGRAVHHALEEDYENGVESPEPTDAELEEFVRTKEITCSVDDVRAVGDTIFENFDEIVEILEANRPRRTSSEEEERRHRGGKGGKFGDKVAALIHAEYFADSACSASDLKEIAKAVHHAAKKAKKTGVEPEEPTDEELQQFIDDEELTCGVADVKEIGQFLYNNREDIKAFLEANRPQRTSSEEEERRHRGGKGGKFGDKVAALIHAEYFADSACSASDLKEIAKAVHHAAKKAKKTGVEPEEPTDEELQQFIDDEELTCGVADVKEVGQFLYNNREDIKAFLEANRPQRTSSEEEERRHRGGGKHGAKIAALIHAEYFADSACSESDLQEIGKAVRHAAKQAKKTGVEPEEPTDEELQQFIDDEELTCGVADVREIGDFLYNNREDIKAFLEANRPQRTSSEEEERRHRGTAAAERRHRGTAAVERRHRGTAAAERRHRGTAAAERRHRGTAAVERRHRTTQA